MTPDERNATARVTIEVTPAEAEMLTDMHIIGYEHLYEALHSVLYSSLIEFEPKDGDDDAHPTAMMFERWRDVLALMRLFAVAQAERVALPRHQG